jgi:hypothetical protein
VPKYCEDPIPEDGIRLSEAFDAYFRASTPDWLEILARLGHVETELGTEQGNHRHRKIFDEWLGCRGKAEHRFRSALCSRELTPLVRDPQTGETLALGRDWERTGSFPATGIDTDFVFPGDPLDPGPDATVRGYARPVYFRRKQFETWLSKTGAKPTRETRRAKSDSIGKAVAVLFPDGVPHGMLIKERDTRINTWLRKHGGAPVSDQTIRRWFRNHPDIT